MPEAQMGALGASSIVSFPVGRQGGLPGNEPAFFQVVVDEVLQQELIHIRAAARTGYRPDIVCEHTESPMARLGEHDDGRPDSNFPCPK